MTPVLCSKCDNILVAGVTWYVGHSKLNIRTCKSCVKKRTKAWKEANAVKVKKQKGRANIRHIVRNRAAVEMRILLLRAEADSLERILKEHNVNE